MPPMYTWKDELSNYKIDILRDYDKYRDEPKDEDLPEGERGKDRKWVKELGKGVSVTKAPGFGKKGYW